MKKGLVIAGSIISVICIIILALTILSIMGFEPESDNILHDTSEDGNSFSFTEDDSYLVYVYAKGTVDCSQFEISITNSSDEYFDRNCADGDLYTTNEYTFLGELQITESTTFEISNTTNEGVIIVDASDIGTDGFFSFASCGCCFIGLILLIVGLVTGKSKPQVVMVQPDGSLVAVQGQVVEQSMDGQIITQPQQIATQPQQYIPQPQETVVEEYSFEQKNEWQ